MSDQTPFEARLADAYVRYVAAAPVEVDARMVAATVATDSAGRALGWPNVMTPDRRVGALLAVGLVALLLAATAISVGSRLTEHPLTGGQLVYAMNDDIYLADQDGAHPRKVADGVPWIDGAGGGPSYGLGDGGPAWAPDGRHFLFFDQQGAADQLTGHIADASGTVIASIPNIWLDATWSPDSTRIEAWTGGSPSIGSTEISIFGIDGALQGSIQLPDGYVRSEESPGFWAPDGRSVYARLGGNGTTSVWQLPIDGSTPRHLAADDPRANGSFAHDGSRLAFVSDWIVSPTLFVSNIDGTDPRALVVGQTSFASTLDANHKTTVWPGGLTWSPDDRQIAFAWVRSNLETPLDSELRIVDVATGSVHTVIAGLQDNGLAAAFQAANGPGLLGWSPAGDRLLFEGPDQKGSSLWSINTDGTDRRLLVDGADSGEWQPVPIP